ncbi:MAG: YqaJ viral recombinase family protein [Acidobacteria bacterium]|nr:YqaJ viral recombinase family protein [Acidobacteriota bacterium]
MPITPHQRRRRQKRIGSSDAPALAHVCPFHTEADVYWSKVTELPDDATAPQRTGNRLENALIDYAAEELGVSVVRNQTRVAGVMGANLDALIKGKREAIEAKQVSSWMAAGWGQPGTAEVPENVLVQVQHQMAVAELDRVWVAVLIARQSFDWALYSVPRDDVLIRELTALETEWWNRHVMAKLPPDGSAPPLAVLKALRREPENVIDLDVDALDILAEWQSARGAKKVAEDREEYALKEILQAMGDAAIARLPDGRLFKYLEESAGARFDTKRFRAEHPDLYPLYTTLTTRHMPRLTKGKDTE